MISNKNLEPERNKKLPADIDKFINAAVEFYQANPTPISEVVIPSEDALDTGKCVSLSEHPWIVDQEMSDDGRVRVPRTDE